VNLKKRVLLIDNDSQGNLTQSLGVSGYDTTIHECITKGLSIDKAIYKTSIPNLDIVPADINYANAELAIANVKDKEFLLKKAGVCWLGGAKWLGKSVMRISVCSLL